MGLRQAIESLSRRKNESRPTLVELDSPIISFEQHAAEPLQWMYVSRNLLEAASRLWTALDRGLRQVERSMKTRKRNTHPDLDGLRLRGPFFLLAGCGIENLLKGLIVSQMMGMGKPPTDARTLQLNVRTHDLIALSQRAGVELSESEQELLRRLTTFVVWGGRYPVALSTDATNESRVIRSDDYRRVRAFAIRIEGLIMGPSAVTPK